MVLSNVAITKSNWPSYAVERFPGRADQFHSIRQSHRGSTTTSVFTELAMKQA
jgi:hypothetical protein